MVILSYFSPPYVVIGKVGLFFLICGTQGACHMQGMNIVRQTDSILTASSFFSLSHCYIPALNSHS
jgi:hypothetical protein